jgi:hypothetical protein
MLGKINHAVQRAILFLQQKGGEIVVANFRIEFAILHGRCLLWIHRSRRRKSTASLNKSSL